MGSVLDFTKNWFLHLIVFLFIAGVLPKYFSSEWSFAQFHLPEDTRFIAAFGSQNTVIIAGLDGRYVIVPVTCLNSDSNSCCSCSISLPSYVARITETLRFRIAL